MKYPLPPTITPFLAAAICGLTALAALAAPAWGQMINEEFKITPSDGAHLDRFGMSVATEDGVLAVGSFTDDDRGVDSGSVYLFDAATKAQLLKWVPNGLRKDDWFGNPVAMGDGLVAAGALGADNNGRDSGAVYVLDVSTGTTRFKLLASDGAPNDNFGYSLAIGGGYIIVGARRNNNGSGLGSVYVFDSETGVQLMKLVPSDGAKGGSFGSSVAIADGVIAVGAQIAGESGSTLVGAAYLIDAATGIEFAKLLPDEGSISSFFGNSIALGNGVVAVGAYKENHYNRSFVGSVYLFRVATGELIAELIPSEDSGSFRLGTSVAIEHGIVVAGCNAVQGYLYHTATGVNIARFGPRAGEPSGTFGRSIDIDEGVIIAGVNLDEVDGIQSGSAIVFDARGCLADLTGDGEVNIQDFTAFLDAWTSSDPFADWDENGIVDTRDLIAYLGNWAAGCP